MLLFKSSLIGASIMLLCAVTGCSPVSAENHAPAHNSASNPTNTTATDKATPAVQTPSQLQTNQSPATKTEEENSIWVRLAKPTCH